MGPKWELYETAINVLYGMHACIKLLRLNLKYIILCANHNLMNLEILTVKNSICTDTCLCKCGDTCAWLPGRYGEGLMAAKVIGQVPVLLFVSWVHCDLPKECQAQEVLTES